MKEDCIVIVSARRTALGGMSGDFAGLPASDLGAAAIRAAVADGGVQPTDIDTVLMGNVLGAGQGQAPARQAALKAGLTLGTVCTTLNKMCGSGMQALMLARTGWAVGDVDLWEVNEAFAVVPMVAMQDLAIPHERMNVLGGACALGHPIGASGARIVVTLFNALKRSGGKRGVAAVCIGGGEATALGIELL